MLITKLMGGLGNQLFQIFTLISVSIDNSIDFRIFEYKDDMEKRPMTFGIMQDDGREVEAGSTDSSTSTLSNGKKELKRLQKALDKNEKVIRMKGKVIDGLTEEIDALHSRMERLEIAHKSNQGCCVVS